MDKKKFDLIVIGSGPGGYVAAIRGAQRGLKTALIEATELGGTCLNRGCIPSKSLIANASVLRNMREAHHFGISCSQIDFDYGAMKERKDKVVSRIRNGLEGLIRSNKITIFRGFGKFLSRNEVKINGIDNEVIEGAKIIIATGSEPKELPLLPFDRKIVHDSTSMLDITELPKRLFIIGGGVIGCEFACLHNAFDVEVTIFELLPTLLHTEGKNVSSAIERSFKKRGIKIETNVVIERAEKSANGVTFHLSDGRSMEADAALVSVGRKFNSDGIGLENAGVAVAPNGTIPIDKALMTNVPGIYAIGDITGEWLYAHYASHQGLIAADHAAGIESTMHKNAVPAVIFTDPEIGTIGLTLEKAIEEGYDAKIGAFPFQALGKAQATRHTEGFAQIVVDKSSGQILGAQVVGDGASALIAEMAVAISHELTVQSIGETIHAHPTIAEAWMEAAFAADDLPLHRPPRPQP